MKKLIYLNHEPLTDNTKRLWMLDELTRKGVDVRYWDIGAVLKTGIKYPNTILDSRLTTVKSFKQLRILLKQERKDEVYFVDEFPYFWKYLWLRCYLKLVSCKLIRINVFYYSSSSKENFKPRLSDLLKKIPDWSLLKLTKLFKLQDYEVVFSPFEKGGKNTIKTNLPDYDTFRRNLSYLKDDNTIVFIDEFFPLHPDFRIKYNYKCTEADVIKYRLKMNALFDYLEHRYQKKVIIAAHPKSNYTGLEFNGREIIYGKTSQLIMSCSIVVSHSGLADSYAILANKSLIFVYSSLFKSLSSDGYCYTSIARRASLLGMVPYNIDAEDLTKIEAKRIPELNRSSFIYSFLTSKESENSFNADIISNYLLNA